MKSDDIIEIFPIKDGEERPDVYDVLRGAMDADLEYVLVIGQTEDDGWYFASSEGDGARAIFSANELKKFIMGIE